MGPAGGLTGAALMIAFTAVLIGAHPIVLIICTTSATMVVILQLKGAARRARWMRRAE